MIELSISSPIKLPRRSIIKIEEMSTTSPIMPVVIFVLASDTFCLSPPEEIIEIAPVMKRKTNQIVPIIVIMPIAAETKPANVMRLALEALPSRPRGP